MNLFKKNKIATHIERVGVVPRVVKERTFDSPARNVETRIVVFDLSGEPNADGKKVVVDFTAQVYRRTSGLGEWKVAHTTEGYHHEIEAAEAVAIRWHIQNPNVMEMRDAAGK